MNPDLLAGNPSIDFVHVTKFLIILLSFYTFLQALLQLPNLTMIYLHGNNIKRLKEVDKLVALTRLKSLSLHGNPIESVSGYRQYIVTHIPQLQTVDFSGVTKADRKVSDVWVKMMIGKDSKETKKPKMTME